MRAMRAKHAHAREKLEAWVEKNPDGYLKLPFKKIAEEAGVSEGSVNENLTMIIARRDGITPDEVTAKREAAGFRQSPWKVPPETAAEIQKLRTEEKLSITNIHSSRNVPGQPSEKY